MTDDRLPVRLSGVSKAFGDVVALTDVDLALQAGKVTCLLGPNGAGKTTLIRVLVGLTHADRGEVHRSNGPGGRSRIGYAAQEISLYPTLSIEENLRHFAYLAGVEPERVADDVARVADELQLGDRSRAVRSCSGGTQRRIHVAAALVHDPEIIVLDEPTAGVDAESRTSIIDIVIRRAAAGCAVLFSTHYFSEADRLARDLAVIVDGNIVCSGPTAEVVARYVEPFVRVAFDGDRPRLEGLPSSLLDDGVLHVKGSFAAVLDASRKIADEQPESEITEIRVVDPLVEHAYDAIVGGAR